MRGVLLKVVMVFMVTPCVTSCAGGYYMLQGQNAKVCDRNSTPSDWEGCRRSREVIKYEDYEKQRDSLKGETAQGDGDSRGEGRKRGLCWKKGGTGETVCPN